MDWSREMAHVPPFCDWTAAWDTAAPSALEAYWSREMAHVPPFCDWTAAWDTAAPSALEAWACRATIGSSPTDDGTNVVGLGVPTDASPPSHCLLFPSNMDELTAAATQEMAASLATASESVGAVSVARGPLVSVTDGSVASLGAVDSTASRNAWDIAAPSALEAWARRATIGSSSTDAGTNVAGLNAFPPSPCLFF
eukprot:CAMPEP_0194552156 /NCGR_PEP_ID=MMETSP0253-20130528/96583_1 /TAXON_ID=2966 /ORGANISM="Noctiluca scintillans" /LENGTH=196 /DNA_ID=CAMNT_0039399621 /DNA_START=327 /DNA_END=914 /DNA_ORIENTATION=-